MNPIIKRLREELDGTGKNDKELVAEGVASQQTLHNWRHLDNTEPKPSSLAKAIVQLGLNGHYILTGHRGPKGEADFQAGVHAACRVYDDLCKAISGAAAETQLASRLEEIHRVLDRHRPPNGGRRRSGGG